MHRERRKRALRTSALIVAVAAFALMAAPANADVCDAIPTIPLVPNPAKTGCKVANGIGGAGAQVLSNPGKAAGSLLTAPLKAAGDSVMQGVTSWVAKGAAWLVEQAGKLIDATTTPRIGSPWFMRQYRTMGALAAVFALPLLLFSVIQGVVRRDGAVIVRAAFVQLPLAFLLAAIAVTVVTLLLALTDRMSDAVASSVGGDAAQFFKDTGKALGAVLAATGGTNPIPLFAVFLGALVAAAAAFCVWLELLIRSAAIYVAVLFLPFTFVAMIWPATARWCRRLIEILIAIVFAKFVIVAIMALAAAGLGHSRGGEGFQGVLAGAALMLLAAFSPFVLLRLVPLAESATVGAGGRRGGTAGAMLAPVASPGAVMRRVVDSNWSSRGSAAARGPATGAVGGGGAGGGAGGAGAATGAAGAVVAGAQLAGGAARSRAEGIGRYGDVGGAGATGTSGQGGDSRSEPPRPMVEGPTAAPETAQPPEPPRPRPRDKEGDLDGG